jgi:opacity protein-like surface antigen
VQSIAQSKSTGENKVKKLLAVVLLSITIATPALAEDSPIYVGALAGDQYFGVLGGYQIDKMYSVEVRYAKILTPDVSAFGISTKTDAYNAGVDLVAMLPWKIKNVPELSFFAKGGLERQSTKVTTTGGGTSISATTTETKLSLGGGAQYEVSKSFSARAGLGVMGTHNDLYVAAIFRF